MFSIVVLYTAYKRLMILWGNTYILFNIYSDIELYLFLYFLPTRMEITLFLSYVITVFIFYIIIKANFIRTFYGWNVLKKVLDLCNENDIIFCAIFFFIVKLCILFFIYSSFVHSLNLLYYSR